MARPLNPFKKFIFNIIWAALCAWLCTKLLLWMNGRFDFNGLPIIAYLADTIQGWGLQIRTVAFGGLVVLFLITNIHRWIGWQIPKLIRLAVMILRLGLWCLAGYCLWQFIMWLASLL